MNFNLAPYEYTKRVSATDCTSTKKVNYSASWVNSPWVTETWSTYTGGG